MEHNEHLYDITPIRKNTKPITVVMHDLSIFGSDKIVSMVTGKSMKQKCVFFSEGTNKIGVKPHSHWCQGCHLPQKTILKRETAFKKAVKQEINEAYSTA
jgi:hypothetical protein